MADPVTVTESKEEANYFLEKSPPHMLCMSVGAGVQVCRGPRLTLGIFLDHMLATLFTEAGPPS